MDYHKVYGNTTCAVNRIKWLEKNRAQLASDLSRERMRADALQTACDGMQDEINRLRSHTPSMPPPVNELEMNIGEWSLIFDRESCKIVRNEQ
jgi:hypothetical protein